MRISTDAEIRKVAKSTEKRMQKFVDSTPRGKAKKGKKTDLSSYQGVRIGGKKYRTFADVPVTPAHKKTTSQKISGGIKLAIL